MYHKSINTLSVESVAVVRKDACELDVRISSQNLYIHCNPRRWGAAQETPQRGRSLSSVDKDLRLLIYEYEAIYFGEPIPVVARYKAWLWNSKSAGAWMSFVSVVYS